MSRNASNVMLEGAEIIFRNFTGKEGPYNREGDRSFAVLLPPDIAEQMAQDGWNVKTLKTRDEDEAGVPPKYYVQASVSYKNRPPKIALITSRGKSYVDESTVEVLDWVDIKTADVILNPYDWAVSGKTGRKAYLATLYLTIDEDPLDLKYGDVPLAVNGTPDRLAIEAGDDADVIRVESERV